MGKPKFSVLVFCFALKGTIHKTSYLRATNPKEHLKLRMDRSLRKISISQYFAYLSHSTPKSFNLTLFFFQARTSTKLFHHNQAVLDDFPKTNPSATVSIIS